MNSLKLLKKESMKRNLKIAISLFIIGCVMLVPGAINLFGQTHPVSFAEMNPEKDSQYVLDYVYLLDIYAENYSYEYSKYATKEQIEEIENNLTEADIDSASYLAIYDNETILSVEIKKGELEAANKACEATISYLTGEAGEDVLTPWYVQGKVTNVSDNGELYALYTDDASQEIADALGSELIDVHMNSTQKYNPLDIVLIVIGSLAILYGVYILILAATGKYQKSVKALLTEMPSEDERIENFFTSTQGRYDVKANKEYLYFLAASETVILHSADVVWIYKEIKNIRGYSMYILNIGTVSGKTYSFNRSKKKIDACASYLADSLENVYFGYNEQIKSMFVQSPRDLKAKIIEARRNAASATMAQSAENTDEEN